MIAGQAKIPTDEQSIAGRGITLLLQKIAEDARKMRDLLGRKLTETERIADASGGLFATVQNLVRRGQGVRKLACHGHEVGR